MVLYKNKSQNYTDLRDVMAGVELSCISRGCTRGVASGALMGAVTLSLVLCADAAFAKNGKKTNDAVVKGDGVTVTLKGEREVKGVYLGRHHKAVWVGVGGGEIGLDEDQVLKVTPSESAEHAHLRRKAALDVHDAKGFWELCKFASENNLIPQADSAARNVLSIDPDHAEARAFFGQKKIGGVWMSYDQAKMSYGLAQFQQGKVLLDGNWISKAEADEIWRARKAPSSNQQARQRPAPEDSSVRKITGTIEWPTE